jgi:uncharacterized protein YndB with AHSA1/START domain
MSNKLMAKASLSIKADKAKVWRGLTDPALIRKYFFGTEAQSDWKKGSPIFFRGVWEGKPYEDKGTILDIDPGNYVTYNYWSNFSGTADVPENYANVTYRLKEKGNDTELVVTQDGIATEEAREHSEKNWNSILDGLKKLLEKE